MGQALEQIHSARGRAGTGTETVIDTRTETVIDRGGAGTRTATLSQGQGRN